MNNHCGVSIFGYPVHGKYILRQSFCNIDVPEYFTCSYIYIFISILQEIIFFYFFHSSFLSFNSFFLSFFSSPYLSFLSTALPLSFFFLPFFLPFYLSFFLPIFLSYLFVSYFLSLVLCLMNSFFRLSFLH